MGGGSDIHVRLLHPTVFMPFLSFSCCLFSPFFYPMCSFFPILVYVAYGMDQGWWFKDKHKVLPTESGTQFNLDKRLSLSGSMAGGGLTPQQCKELVRSVAHTVGQKASGEKADEVIKMLALQQMKPGRAALRINAVRMMTGGKRVAPSKEKINKASETTAMLNAPELPVVQFKSDMYMVSEGDGKLDVCVSRVNARGVCSVQFETVSFFTHSYVLSLSYFISLYFCFFFCVCVCLNQRAGGRDCDIRPRL